MADELGEQFTGEAAGEESRAPQAGFEDAFYGPYIVLEVGSGSVSLHIENPDSRIKDGRVQKETIALGDFLPGDEGHEHPLSAKGQDTPKLDPEIVDKLLEQLKSWKRHYFRNDDSYVHISAIGAGALRAISQTDQKAFIKRFKDELGLDLKIVTPEEEVKLMTEGIKREFPDAKNALVIDQGGSTLEISVLDDAGDIIFADGYDLGTYALKNHENPDAVIAERLNLFFETYGEVKFEQMYVTGGSPRQLFKNGHKGGASADDMRSKAQAVLDTPEEDLKENHNISVKRTPLVHGSARVMLALLSNLNIEDATPSKLGLREGEAARQIEAQRQMLTEEYGFDEPELACEGAEIS